MAPTPVVPPEVDLTLVASAYGLTQPDAVAVALRTQALLAAWQIGREGGGLEQLVALIYAPPLAARSRPPQPSPDETQSPEMRAAMDALRAVQAQLPTRFRAGEAARIAGLTGVDLGLVGRCLGRLGATRTNGDSGATAAVWTWPVTTSR